MILYHGTSGIAGDQILKDGVIKSDCDRLFSNLPKLSNKKDTLDASTTNGYVYLTQTPYLALNYGFNANKINSLTKSVSDNFIYIFQVTVTEDKLEPDADEALLIDTGSAAKYLYPYQYRYSDDIILANSTAYFVKLPYHGYSEDESSLISQLSVHSLLLAMDKYDSSDQEIRAKDLAKAFDNLYQWTLCL